MKVVLEEKKKKGSDNVSWLRVEGGGAHWRISALAPCWNPSLATKR